MNKFIEVEVAIEIISLKISIMGYADTLLEDDCDEETIQKVLNVYGKEIKNGGDSNRR